MKEGDTRRRKKINTGRGAKGKAEGKNSRIRKRSVSVGVEEKHKETQINLSPGRDVNPRPPNCKEYVLSAGLRSSGVE
jgi:hypothetical protein